MNRFDDVSSGSLEQYLFQEACRLEQTGPLLMQAKRFLREANILFPADDTLRRLIITQRQAARAHIYERISNGVPSDLKLRLDDLLVAAVVIAHLSSCSRDHRADKHQKRCCV